MTRKDTPRPLTVLIPALLVAGFVLADRSDSLKGGAADPVSQESQAKREALAAFSQLPMTFEPNRGQAPKGVQFTGHGGTYVMGISPTEAKISVWSKKPKHLRPAKKATMRDAYVSAHMQMKFVGANPSAKALTEGNVETRINYFKGKDPKKWVTDLPVFEKLRYQSVYPGIDLVYYGNQTKFEYDFVVKPGAAPGDITLQFDGAKGMRVDEKTGELVLALAEGEFRQGAPVMFQEKFGARESVSGSYALLDNNQVSFNIDGYDPTRELVIDPPIIGYSGYLGGGTYDAMTDVVTDSQGYAYVVGAAISADFPTTPSIVSPPADYLPAFDTVHNDGQTDWDVVVCKVAPPGVPVDETRARLVYSTFVGGNRGDMEFVEPGPAIARDSAGRVYFTSESDSDNYPTTSGALQTTRAGNFDIVLTVIAPTGNQLLYSTHYGGTNTEYAGGLTLDVDGAVVFGGRTNSSINGTFPLSNAYQTTGTDEAFVARLVPTFQTLPTPSTMAISFSSLIGGNQIDQAEDVSTWKDGSNVLHVYLSGFTYSKDFPLSHHLQVHSSTTDLSTDAFISKFAWSGGALSLEWSTLLGGSTEDHAFAIEARQTDGIAFIGGRVSNTPLAFQADPYKTGGSATNPITVTGPASVAHGNSDGFILRLRDPVDALPASRVRVDYWTIYGALGYDQIMDIKFDPSNNDTVWVAGMSSSQTNTTPAFPIANAIQGTKTGGDNSAFVAKVSTTTAGLPGVEVSTFWGGTSPSSNDWGTAIAPMADNCPILVGYTAASQDFPVVGGPQLNYGGGTWDGYISKLCPNDVSAFQIYKVDITSVSSTSAVVTWQTNRASNSRVRIGLASGSYFREVTPSLGLPNETTGNVFTHRVMIGDGVGGATALPANTPTTDSALTPNTIYYIQVLSTTPSPVESAQSADVKILTTAPYPKFRINSTTFRQDGIPAIAGKFLTHVKIRNTGGVTANTVDITRVRFWSLLAGKTQQFQDWETRDTSGNAFGSPSFGMPSGSGTATGNLGVNAFGYLQYRFDSDTAFLHPANTSVGAVQALKNWAANASVRIDITGTYTNSAGPGGTFAASHRIRMPASPSTPASLP